MDKSIQFLLVPDKYAARKVRRCIAETGGRLGVIVGTWLELLSLAKEKYLISELADDWNASLLLAMSEINEAFWTESFIVAPSETLASVNQVLLALLVGVEPGQCLAGCDLTPLSSRARKHFSDLAALQKKLGGKLPPALRVIKEILAAEKPLQAIRVYNLPALPLLNSWQEALLGKLSMNVECCQGDDHLQNILVSSLAVSTTASNNSSLFHLQQNLFGDVSPKTKLDDSLQWISCRDSREEVEVAVSMIQQLLADDAALSPADIGIMLPRGNSYGRILDDVARVAGLPICGLGLELVLRDLGREAVMLFITTRKQPAPVMSLASLLSHPLMPWSQEHGMILAQNIMDGKFDFKTVPGMNDQGRQMLSLIKSKIVSSADLKRSLAEFVGLFSAQKELSIHLDVAKAVAVGIIKNLGDEGEPPWQFLISSTSPQLVSIPETTIDPKDGLCVFHESTEPWRKLRHLFVLGFSGGSYPIETSTSAIFSETDLVVLKDKLHLKVDTGDDLLSRRRALFKRQIASVVERVVFFNPWRDYFGKELSVSSSLTFMALLFEGVMEPEELLLNIDREVDRKKILGLPEIEILASILPHESNIADLDLCVDLMTIGCKADGTLKSQSPSSISTLMSSPLAWLFDRAKIKPREWVPETLDVRIKGILAHAVFEHLFPKGSSFPSHQIIAEQVPTLLYQAISSICPFLRTPEWHVERHHLEREIIESAKAWSDLLTGMKATVFAAEIELQGEIEGIPVYGRADLIIELPGEKALVIDFKKSKSKSRRKLMVSGYDSQADLYRRMLKAGGIIDEKLSLPDGIKIGVMYYLMDDQVALCDSSCWFAKPLTSLEELGEGISNQAVALIKKRISKVRKGEVRLNRNTDEKWFEKNTGIKIYALGNSPLLRMFMLPGEEDQNEIA